jgi:hypothetical protein
LYGLEASSLKRLLQTFDREELGRKSYIMSAEKRAASNSFGSSQMVKRQKSDANLNGSAVVVVNGGRNGALIQHVSLASDHSSSFNLWRAKYAWKECVG